MSETFKTILSETEAEYKDRGSRFIAYSFPIENLNEVKEKISWLKKNNLKARHHCYAYRIGNDKTIFRAVDDGEPSGTAGLPIMGEGGNTDAQRTRHAVPFSTGLFCS